MSRIGKLPISVPADVTVSVDANNVVTVKGPKGTLTQEVKKGITVSVEGSTVTLTRKDDTMKKEHGLYRQLINNMVKGVKEGFKKSLIINGVGYKVAKQGKKVVMHIGLSHTVEVEEVEGITLACPSQTEITVEGYDKAKVGQIAANIRAIKPVEVYHGYGIRYSDEVVILKEGKSSAKGGKK